MKVTWHIEDGYCGGKARPQTVEVPDNILDACEDDNERENIIEEYVQTAFDNKVTWVITKVGDKKYS